MGWGPRPALYRLVLAGAWVVLLAGGSLWLAESGLSAVIAGVLSLVAAVVIVAASVLLRLRPSISLTGAMVDRTTRELAVRVAEHEGTIRYRLLGDPRATSADVSFTEPNPAWLPADLHVGRDREELSASRSDIRSFFMQCSTRRLVICGAGGGGKTMLANRLLLDLIQGHVLGGGDTPVPVRLSLPSFDPGSDHDDAALVAARLDAWIGDQLTVIYVIRRRVARALVDQGRIVPILDGLDEMDSDTGPATRAEAVIEALNHHASGRLRSCVITCRTDRYRELAATGTASEPTGQAPLKHAAVVELKPHTPQQIADYIRRRFPDREQRQRAERRWQPLVERLRDEPEGPLATVLGSPLRLFLLVTAYYGSRSQPAELLDLSADAIDRQLFRMYIPAVTSRAVGPGGSYYLAADVAGWMGTLASHLTAQSRHGGSGFDLDLSTLWTATRSSVPRYVAAAVHSLLVALALGAGAGLYLSSHLIKADLLNGIAYIVGSVAVVAYTFFRASRAFVELSRLDISSLRTASGRRRLVSGLAPGLVAGLVGGLAVGPTAGLALGLAVAVVGGFSDAVAKAVTRRPAGIAHPSELITQGVAHDVVVLLSYGAIGWLVAAVAGGFPFKPSAGYIGLSFGLAAGGVTIAVSPWMRYFAATRILADRHELPWRLAQFLNWAYYAGLVRIAGIFIQFRHRELQEQLAHTPAFLSGQDR